MRQEGGDLDGLVRKRIRALRVAQGWSLDELASRAKLSPSSLSRIENGQRRLALDQLVTLARALDTSLDQLVETDTDDVIVSPMLDGAHGTMRWPIKAEPGMTVMRQRMTTPPPDNPASLRALRPRMAGGPVGHDGVAARQPEVPRGDQPGRRVPDDAPARDRHGRRSVRGPRHLRPGGVTRPQRRQEGVILRGRHRGGLPSCAMRKTPCI